jgi:tetratricopeptide (TPR) repeat protein
MRLATRRRTPKPAPNRRQRVPPALTRGPDRVEAISILDEIPGDLGLMLWRAARNILLWAETPASGRAALFAGDACRARHEELLAADVEPELRAPLSVFAELLCRPGEVDVLRLVNACRRTASWAEQQGRLRAALEFSQAAALVSPDSASLAFGVGRVARRMAEYDRAESWYTRAVVQARDSRDWRAYTSGLLGMGNLHKQRGNYPAAKRSYLRCLHAADRRGLREALAAANHSLFSVEVEMQAGMEADVLAARALDAYDAGHPDVVRLAHDVAHHWALQGYYSGALQVGLALADVVHDLTVAPSVHALVARAAGGMGDRALYESAVERCDELLSDPALPDEMAARTLLVLSHAAFNIGDRKAAAGYADEAMSIARRRAEGRIALEAEAMLEAAMREEAAAAAAEAPATSAPKLAVNLVRALTHTRELAAMAA